MSKRLAVRSSLAGLTWLLLGATAALPAEPAAKQPPRVKPLTARTLGLKPWEKESTSPDGSSRWGGTDKRRFAFSPGGTLLASEDAGGWQLEVWDTVTGKSRGRFGRINDPVELAFAPDGKHLITTEPPQSPIDALVAVVLWDAVRQKKIKSLDEGVIITPFGAVAFSPDGKSVALANTSGFHSPDRPIVRVWNLASGEEARKIEGPEFSEEESTRGHPYIDCLCFSPDGKTLVLVRDRKILLWEMAIGKERCQLGLLPQIYRQPQDYEDRKPVVAFSPDGRTLAIGCVDGMVRLWDVVTGTELLPLAGHKAAVRVVVFAADGKTLLSYGRDDRLLTWRVADARQAWPRPRTLEAPVLAALWNDLRGENRLVLEEALRTLAAVPASSLPFLRQRLKPVPAVDSAHIEKLVADLTNEDFNVRRRAAIELRKLGDLAIPALEKARKRTTGGLEAVPGHLLGQLNREYPTRAQIQALYALDALERMGTDEARRLLAELAKGAPQALLTQKAQVVLKRLKEKAPTGIEKETLEKLWIDLASPDAARAFRAIRALCRRENETLPFLGRQLRPLAARDSRDDPKRIARLIADLDSDQYAVREKASKELAELGRNAQPPLRQALEGSASPEVKRRIKSLLSSAGTWTITPKELQIERALEVIEHASPDRARQLLKDLAREGRNVRLQEAIAASHRRLGGG